MSNIGSELSSNEPRLLPSTKLPEYTYVPGSDTPHPIRDPRGHSYQRKSPPPRMLTPSNWAENSHYLLGLDFFNYGFYWEAHEEFERLWRASGPDTAVGKFLKGLVKLSAAGVKVRENSIHGVRRHAASAGELFADLASEVGTEYFCGLEFTLLQFAADRAAQISYKDRISSPYNPNRVFPFILEPEELISAISNELTPISHEFRSSSTIEHQSTSEMDAWYEDGVWALEAWGSGQFDGVAADYVAIYLKNQCGFGNDPDQLQIECSRQLGVPVERIVIWHIGSKEMT